MDERVINEVIISTLFIAQQHGQILHVLHTLFTNKHSYISPLTCLSAPPAPGRRWCERSHCRNVRGWSLCIFGTPPRWPPRPPGSATGRTWTLCDAAALAGTLYHVPLREKGENKTKVYHQTDCKNAENAFFFFFFASLPLPAGIRHYVQEDTRGVLWLHMKHIFKIKKTKTKHVCKKKLMTFPLGFSDNLFFVHSPSSSIFSRQMTQLVRLWFTPEIKHLERCSIHVGLWLKHLWGMARGAVHLVHTEPMIERCRRTLTALRAPFFSLSSSRSPRESSSLPFIWFSWVGAPCFGVPRPHPLLTLPHIPAFQTPTSTPMLCPPWPRFSHVPAGYPRGQCLVSHHLHQLSDRPPTCTYTPVPTSANRYIKTHKTHSKLAKIHESQQQFMTSVAYFFFQSCPACK